MSILLTAEQVTNRYLYGQDTKPENMLDPSTWGNDRTITVDREEFMKTNGRFFAASSFDVINTFMGGETDDYKRRLECEAGDGKYITFTDKDDPEKTTYTTSEVLAKLQGAQDLGESVSLNKYEMSVLYGYKYIGLKPHQGNYGINDSDHMERTYIWGIQEFKIGDDTRFIIHPDGRREIQDFYIDVNNDNFDFTGEGLSSLANGALGSIVDPSGIGRKVEFKFDGDIAAL